MFWMLDAHCSGYPVQSKILLFPINYCNISSIELFSYTLLCCISSVLLQLCYKSSTALGIWFILSLLEKWTKIPRIIIQNIVTMLTKFMSKLWIKIYLHIFDLTFIFFFITPFCSSSVAFFSVNQLSQYFFLLPPMHVMDFCFVLSIGIWTRGGGGKSHGGGVEYQGGGVKVPGGWKKVPGLETKFQGLEQRLRVVE